MFHLLPSAHDLSFQSVTYDSLKLSWHSCCHLNFFERQFLPKNSNMLPFILKFTLVLPCNRPRYTSQPCFLVSPFLFPLVLTPWFLIPGAWPRRVSQEEPKRRWREKGGRAGAERHTPKPQLQQPCLALPSLPLLSLHFT